MKKVGCSTRAGTARGHVLNFYISFWWGARVFQKTLRRIIINLLFKGEAHSLLT